MQITLQNISKKYKSQWIFRNVNYTFEKGKKYAILGENGSGKSTLLKIVSGQTTPNKGTITYFSETEIEIENIHQKLSYCAPYIDLIEELTFTELIDFVRKFKPFTKTFDAHKLQKQFNFSENKWIKDYSSGMKQRVKLILALYLDVDLILLDEPTNNLDEEGVKWYLKTINEIDKNKTIIIASNIKREYEFCDEVIKLSDYK